MRQAVAQSVRAAEREHRFALAQLRVGRQRQRRQLQAVDLQQREIELGGDADNARGDDLRLVRQRRRQGPVRVVDGQDDLHAPRAVHDVRVGQDVALGVDDESRSGGLLAIDDGGGGARIFAGRVAADHDVHDARPDLARQRVDRLVHPRQRILNGGNGAGLRLGLRRQADAHQHRQRRRGSVWAWQQDAATLRPRRRALRIAESLGINVPAAPMPRVAHGPPGSLVTARVVLI